MRFLVRDCNGEINRNNRGRPVEGTGDDQVWNPERAHVLKIMYREGQLGDDSYIMSLALMSLREAFHLPKNTSKTGM